MGATGEDRGDGDDGIIVSEEEEEEGEGEVVDEEGGDGVPQEEETVGEFESQLEAIAIRKD